MRDARLASAINTILESYDATCPIFLVRRTADRNPLLRRENNKVKQMIDAVIQDAVEKASPSNHLEDRSTAEDGKVR